MTAVTLFPLALWLSNTLQNSVPTNDNGLRIQALLGAAMGFAPVEPADPVENVQYIVSAEWDAWDIGTIVIYKSGTWYGFAPYNGQGMKLIGTDWYVFQNDAWKLQSPGDGGGGGTALIPMVNDGTRLVAKTTITETTGQKDVTASSVDHGATWAQYTESVGFSIAKMAYGASKYIAMGPNGWVGYTDAVDHAWTSQQITNYPVAGISGGISMVDVLYDSAGSRYVMAGAYGIILTSSDGATWAEKSSNGLQTGGYGSGSISSLIKSGSTFYAVFVLNDGSQKLYSSADLQTWTVLYTNTDTTKKINVVRVLNSVILVMGYKVVSGRNRPFIMASTDGGSTWNERSPSPTSGNTFGMTCDDMGYFNSLYVMFGQNIEGYTSNLTSWSLNEPTVAQTTSHPVQDGSVLLQLFQQPTIGTSVMRKSTNGSTWA